MKKRCAILTLYDPFKVKGGIDSYIHQLAAILQSRGVAVDIFHLQRLPGPPSEWFESAHFQSGLLAALRRPVHKLHRWLRSYRPEGRFLARAGRALPFDPRPSPFLKQFYPVGRAFFSVDHRYDFVIAQAFAGYGYFPPRIPAFTVLHSTHVQYADDSRESLDPQWFDDVRSLVGFGAERLSTVGNHVIAVSEEVAQEARTLYGAKTVTVVETGIDTKVFFPRPDRVRLREKFSVAPEDFVAVFLGNWAPAKGVDVLESVMARTPAITWVLVLGTGPPCPLEPGPRLKILHNLEPDAVAEALSMADALFHPSRYEGFGLAMVEAMACGLPVVAAPVGVMRGIGQQASFSSVLLPPYAGGKERVTDAAVAALERLRADPALACSLSEAGLALARRRFGHARWESEMLAVLGVAG